MSHDDAKMGQPAERAYDNLLREGAHMVVPDMRDAVAPTDIGTIVQAVRLEDLPSKQSIDAGLFVQ